MTTTQDTPRVWIGCLACYNGGDLVGFWIDADEANDVTSPIEAFAAHMRAAEMSYPPEHDADAHEEFWVMEHDNFHGVLTGECSPAEAQRVAEALEAFVKEGGDVKALGAYKSYNGMDLDEAIESFSDHYEGEWDSERDFAYHWAEDVLSFEAATDGPGAYIDWDRYATDLFTSFIMVDGYVFSA